MIDEEALKAIATLAGSCHALEVQSQATERMLSDSIIIPGNKVTSILTAGVLVFAMLVMILYILMY